MTDPSAVPESSAPSTTVVDDGWRFPRGKLIAAVTTAVLAFLSLAIYVVLAGMRHSAGGGPKEEDVFGAMGIVLMFLASGLFIHTGVNARTIPDSIGASTIRGLAIVFFVLGAAGIVFSFWMVWMATL